VIVGVKSAIYAFQFAGLCAIGVAHRGVPRTASNFCGVVRAVVSERKSPVLLRWPRELSMPDQDGREDVLGLSALARGCACMTEEEEKSFHFPRTLSLAWEFIDLMLNSNAFI
jgi:hypothetical protein